MAKEFYISNKSNRCLPIIDIRPVSENDIDASYDERGNLLKLSGTQNLHWNYRDNIAYVDIITRPSGKNDSEYYVYDSSGQRVRKVTETYQNNEKIFTRVEKIYFGDIEVTRTYQDNNLSKEKYTLHVADDKSRVALHHYWTKGASDETRESQDRYQLSNHLDSVALELNDNAEIITYEEYLPFGGTALIAGKTAREVTEKEYRYSGKERDDSTGLYYYGARYYAPWLLRWINPDPAGTVDGLNLYLFVKGNPVNSIDLFGLIGRNHEWTRLNGGIGWKVDASRGDSEELLRSEEKDITKYIREGVQLALKKIESKLGTIDIKHFAVKQFSKVEFDDEVVIFPVEMVATITQQRLNKSEETQSTIKTKKQNHKTKEKYKLNINIDNPSEEDTAPSKKERKPIEGPHGPHVGAEITAVKGTDASKNLHAHILLKDIEGIPSRTRQRELPHEQIIKAISEEERKVVLIEKDLLLSRSIESETPKIFVVNPFDLDSKKALNRKLRKEFNMDAIMPKSIKVPGITTISYTKQIWNAIMKYMGFNAREKRGYRSDKFTTKINL